ncbi:centrosomal protein of 89 kDa [Centroberyx affinis]|uniref:centrosomal protein of 89 kDa n=1 Tax=Centroberyx affinis TaxID=166261 RepID=UPI003A5C607D
MFKFTFGREKDKEFRHIAHGLIPAASIAPKPAVPRTPPPRSPNPSPERPRSALAAAILSSSLTGQTWAIPPARVRSFSESDRSQSFISEPNLSTALYNRDRWSEELSSRPHLPSADHSEEELEDKEEEEEKQEEENVYQTLDRRGNCPITEPVYALPLKPKTSPPQLNQMSLSGRRMPSPDFTEETSTRSPKASRDSSKKKASIRESTGSWKEVSTTNPPTSATLPNPPSPTIPHPPNHPNYLTHPTQSTAPNHPTRLSAEASEAYREVHKEVQKEVQKEVVWALTEHNTRLAEERRLLEERLQRLEQELSHSQASSSRRPSAGVQAELQTLRQQAQELVDENDGLKLTVHHLNVELSRYQAQFRPLSKHESSRINSLPMKGSPPPWLLDMKYLSPLLLAYEDRMNEKDALLQAAEEEVKKLRVRLEEVIRENERLHDEIAKTGGVSQKDCRQLQQQAVLVLQENQVLIDQLEVQHVKTKASHSRHHSEVSKVSKQLMLLEVEKQHLQEELDERRREAQENRREVQENMREVQALQARLKDAVTWEEHCDIVSKLRRQLEQEEARKRNEVEELHLRVSSLQEENRSLALDKANRTADIKRMEAELELSRQANRKAERRMSALKQQKEECVLKEVKTHHYLGAVVSVAEQISQERDQLVHMASILQQDKQKFISRILEGTVRFEKLQEEVKVYRRQASSRLAALEEAAEGKTASYGREILHLQRLLGERQEAEERLLQYKREVEEELEVVWQAATRENQQMRATLLDSSPSGELHGRAILCGASPSWPSHTAVEEITTSPQLRPHSSGPPLFTSCQSRSLPSAPPGLQRGSIFESDSDHQNNSLEERQKHGLDFYC